MRKFICTAALAALCVPVLADVSAEAQTWWSHVEYLANDSMSGRKAGTPGYDKAAQYVADQFAKAGLKPGAGSGYLQSITLREKTIDETRSYLKLVSDGKEKTLVLGKDATLGLRGDPKDPVDAPAVFVGYGLQIPEHGIDDLKGIDLKGKLAVILSGAPKEVPAALAAHAQSAAQRWANLRAAGAVGTIGLVDAKTVDIPWERAVLTRTQPVVGLTDPAMIDTAGQRAAVSIGPSAEEELFGGSGHTFAEILELHRTNKPLPKFPLALRVKAHTAFTSREVRSSNVVGILPGSDPKLAKEYVVLSAHLDHIGVGAPVNGDGIYNGAMDNATGIATLIEVAKSLSKTPPKRSVLFAAVTAEESGLLGSRYFANRPTVEAGGIVANINFDMYLPLIPLRALVVYGMDESTLSDEFKKTAKEFNIRAVADPEPHRNAFVRSDQYSFIRQGIPALAVKFHADKGTPEEKVMAEWRSKRYHGTTDDLAQPVDKDAAVQFNALVTAFSKQVGNMPLRPEWKKDSFFRRFAPAGK